MGVDDFAGAEGSELIGAGRPRTGDDLGTSVMGQLHRQ